MLLLLALLPLRIRFGFGSRASALRLWRGISKTHRLVDLAGPAGVGRFLCLGFWLLSLPVVCGDPPGENLTEDSNHELGVDKTAEPLATR